MSTPRLLISRAGLTTQDVLADEFSLEQQDISNETLEGLNLTGIIFNEVKVNSCSFIRNDFSGDQFYSTEINKTTFINCDFTNCELSDTLFAGCVFTDCIFGKCEFYDCLFDACTFLRVNMNWSYHASSRFIKGGILHSFFENAIISSCHFLNVRLDENVFLEAKILNSEVNTDSNTISDMHNVKLILSGRR